MAEIPEFLCSSVTELLILAHNCFSLTCHMEGITRVLQAARLLTDEHLAPNDEYGLMVRVFAAAFVASSVSARNCSEQRLEGWAVVEWRSPSPVGGSACAAQLTLLNVVVVLQEGTYCRA